MKEVFPLSEFYGAARILKEYARFLARIPIPAQIQHGWYFEANSCDACKAPEYWCWTSRIRDDFLRKFEGERAWAIGAPFLYLLKNYGYQETPRTNRRGTIVFPCHSSQQLEAVCDYDEYADQLLELPAEFHPITVCMYYVDLQHGHDEPFRKRGFPIVSNGVNRLSADFLISFIENSRNHEFVLSNQMTSALLYGVEMGLTGVFYGPSFAVNNNGNKSFQDKDPTEQFRSWEEMYAGPFRLSSLSLEGQRIIAREELGSDLILSPRQLRNRIWRLCFNYKFMKKTAKEMLRAIKRKKTPAKKT